MSQTVVNVTTPVTTLIHCSWYIKVLVK